VVWSCSSRSGSRLLCKPEHALLSLHAAYASTLSSSVSFTHFLRRSAKSQRLSFLHITTTVIRLSSIDCALRFI
jgi:hypothetical protein